MLRKEGRRKGNQTTCLLPPARAAEEKAEATREKKGIQPLGLTKKKVYPSGREGNAIFGGLAARECLYVKKSQWEGRKRISWEGDSTVRASSGIPKGGCLIGE